jgi:hypothetical protein
MISDTNLSLFCDGFMTELHERCNEIGGMFHGEFDTWVADGAYSDFNELFMSGLEQYLDEEIPDCVLPAIDLNIRSLVRLIRALRARHQDPDTIMKTVETYAEHMLDEFSKDYPELFENTETDTDSDD